MGASGDDLAVEGVDDGGDFRAGAAGDLVDGGEAVVGVTGVDALGAVAEVEDPPLPRPLPHRAIYGTHWTRRYGKMLGSHL